MSIVEQAGRVHDASGGSLSREIAGAVMQWAQENRAYRHMVSFETLDEAVGVGLGGKTSRREVSTEDRSKVGDAVRGWIQPHLREGVDVAGIDRVVSDAIQRPRSLDAKGRDDVEPTIVASSVRSEGR